MSSRSGNKRKGLVFTMDVVFSIGITLFLLLLALVTLVSIAPIFVSEVNAKRIASDIVAALDYNDVLDSFNEGLIEGAVNSTLPSNLRVYMVISKFTPEGLLVDQLVVNENIEENYFTGKWMFVTNAAGKAANYYLVSYKVGIK